MITYLIVNEEFDVTIYYEYDTYADILRYYNVGDLLHSNEVIQTHYTLTIF